MKTKDYSGIRNDGPLPSCLEVQIPEDIGDMLGDYIDSCTSQLEELEPAVLVYESDNNDVENCANIRRILHKIKSEASMMGFEDIAALFHEAESAFEELDKKAGIEMLLRLKDWTLAAMQNMKREI